MNITKEIAVKINKTIPIKPDINCPMSTKPKTFTVTGIDIKNKTGIIAATKTENNIVINFENEFNGIESSKIKYLILKTSSGTIIIQEIEIALKKISNSVVPTPNTKK